MISYLCESWMFRVDEIKKSKCLVEINMEQETLLCLGILNYLGLIKQWLHFFCPLVGVGRGTRKNYRETKGTVSQESLGTDVVVVNTVEKYHWAISVIVSASCWPHSVLGSVPISSSCGFPAWVTSAFFFVLVPPPRPCPQGIPFHPSTACQGISCIKALSSLKEILSPAD